MTNFKFISDLLNIINALLQEGITGCSVHEARGYLAELFDSFEEHEGLPCHDKNDRGDLELYAYLIDSLHQDGYSLWLEEQEQKIKPTLSEADFIRELYKLTGVPYDLQAYMNLPFGEDESEVETIVTIQGIDYPNNT